MWVTSACALWHSLPLLKQVVLSINAAVYVGETYLLLRQRRKAAIPVPVPAEVAALSKPEEIAQSRRYTQAKLAFALFTGFYDMVQTTAIILLDVLPWLWQCSAHVLARAGYDAAVSPILQSCVFITLYSLGSTVLSQPTSLYNTFVIEERFGFNKQTLGLYIKDLVKSTLVTSAIGLPIAAAFIKIIAWAGDNFPLYVWAFIACVQVVMITLYPIYIAPLFNTFTPLEDGELKSALRALADRVRFPLTKMFVIDGSTRSGHSNAYFTGLFREKRIVIFDTLIAQNSVREICAVGAHEMGHWAHSHIVQSLLISQVHLLAVFYGFRLAIHYGPLYTAFGFHGPDRPILIGFLLFGMLNTPIDTLVTFMMNVRSRHNEFQADRYAVDLGYAADLKTALTKLHVKNLGNLNPDAWYSAWHYSHPPLVERLRAMDRDAASKKKE